DDPREIEIGAILTVCTDPTRFQFLSAERILREMSSVERSVESGSDLGVDGVARLDVVLRHNELEWRHITDAIAVNVVVQSTTGTCLFANGTALQNGVPTPD